MGVGHFTRDASLLRGADDVLAVLQVQSERLFNEHVLALCNRIERQVPMPRRMSRDDDAVDTLQPVLVLSHADAARHLRDDVRAAVLR